MTDRERAAGTSPVDLDGRTEILPDDSADLVSSDLAAAAMGLLYGILFLAVIVGAAWFIR